MKHNTHGQVAVPMDVYAMLGMQAPPFEFAEKAYRAWLDSAQTMRAEASEFVNTRATKDMAALSEWARCKTPTDLLEVQARYASEALSDYVTGSQRMFQWLSSAGQPGVGAAT